MSDIDDKISIAIGEDETDKNNVTEKPQTDKNIDKPHNGKLITLIEISPNGKYLVTYCREDKSFVGWNVDDINEGQLKPDTTVNLSDHMRESELAGFISLRQMCVSDDKKLAYINYYNERLSK